MTASLALLAGFLLSWDGPAGHSHNDYEQTRPLEIALESGMRSIEADVFPVDGQLWVAHDKEDLKPSRTLVGMYLQPLADRIRRNGGSVYGDGKPLVLLVDIKQDGAGSYAILKRELQPFKESLTRFEGGKVRPGAVTVILSGDRPIDLVAGETERTVFVDGRLPDLDDSERPATLIPLVSANWSSAFRWRGAGAPPAEEVRRLRDLVSKARSRGQMLRFWNTPDDEGFWRVLREADVDLIGTDDPARLQAFLASKRS